MKFTEKTIAVLLASATLASTTGCDTAGQGAANGALFGAGLGAVIGAATGRPALGAAIGAASGAATGAIIGSINQEQRARLAADYPTTYQTIQHNDAVYQQQQQPQPPPAQQPATGQAPAPAPADQTTYTPITVNDIKALDTSGVKKDVIITEIERSHSTFSAADISSLQQADPNVDPDVINCMKQHPS
jgi:hypothetical protein